jgi:hypothetical protein
MEKLIICNLLIEGCKEKLSSYMLWRHLGACVHVCIAPTVT